VSFELQPTLTGQRLALRPLRPDDWDALFAAAADPRIWEQHPETDRYQPDVFRRYFDSGLASGGAFAVIDRETGGVVGSTRYYGYDEAASEIEIGWTFLARQYWGKSYNGEMKSLLLDHAFRFVKRVVFLVGPSNVRSQRAMEKIGGARIGTRLARGHESVVFAIEAPAERSADEG
jgi:RimJ/RimL family protein N-acetyltransferase